MIIRTLLLATLATASTLAQASTFEALRAGFEADLLCKNKQLLTSRHQAAFEKAGAYAQRGKEQDQAVTHTLKPGLQVFGAPATSVSFFGHEESGFVGMGAGVDAPAADMVKRLSAEGLKFKTVKGGGFEAKRPGTSWIVYVSKKGARAEIGCYFESADGI